jgi:hypothetical protein
MGTQFSKTRRVILLGGTFDDQGGAPSTIIAQMHAAMPEGTVLFNGGYFNKLPELIKEITFFDVALWFPNVSNDKNKIGKNSRLDGFLSFFEEKKCDKYCDRCTHCKRYYDRSVSIRGNIEEYKSFVKSRIDRLEEVPDCTISVSRG